MSNQCNALLESPTGSGKTLALLCASLAWQAKHKATVMNEAREEALQAVAKGAQTKGKFLKGKENKDEFGETTIHEEIALNGISIKEQVTEQVITQQEKFDAQLEIALKGKVKSRIYYATRTHSQIEQVVRELRKTQYRPQMTVLGSRDQYCIHHEISKLPNKNEHCKELIEHGQCGFGMANFNKLVDHEVFRGNGAFQVWDIEDLVGFGKKIKACPYFLSREILVDSGCDIIFCPYNYLLDPLIRKMMNIDLNQAVVIIDEAHNVEDVCRDTVSGTFSVAQIGSAVLNFQELIDKGLSVEKHSSLQLILKKLGAYLLDNNDIEPKYGDNLLKLLDVFGVNRQNFPAIKTAVNEVIEKKGPVQNNPQPKKINKDNELNSSTISLMESFTLVFGLVLESPLDYRFVLVKEGIQEDWKCHFWCMSPALSFGLLAKNVRCLILTSGTLTPMSLLMTELGVSFPITLEAPHVINPSQVCVLGIARGPPSLQNDVGATIKVVYENTEDLSFQDAIGNSVFHILKSVPNGVLVFLSSYTLIEKLFDRWRKSGILQRLNEIKRIFVEPKSTEMLEPVMQMYTKTVRITDPSIDLSHHADIDYLLNIEERIADARKGNETPPSSKRFKASRFQKKSKPREISVEPMESTQNGAVFFAVFRGKISEGIDFADEYARAVVSVGIPFASATDLQVKLKQSYNSDKSHAAKISGKISVLDGRTWYNMCAYRALNQAIGRCIRHKNDFGAIIFLEERLTQSQNTQHLSKWIRDRVEVAPFLQQVSKLVSFFEDQRSLKPKASSISNVAVGSAAETIKQVADPKLATIVEAEVQKSTLKNALDLECLSPKETLQFKNTTQKQSSIVPIMAVDWTPRTKFHPNQELQMEASTPWNHTPFAVNSQHSEKPVVVKPLFSIVSSFVASFTNSRPDPINLAESDILRVTPLAPKKDFLSPCNIHVASPIPFKSSGTQFGNQKKTF